MPPSSFDRRKKISPDPLSSTVGLLIDSARELGKLDELAVALESAASDHVEWASDILMLVRLAKGQIQIAEPELRKRLEELEAKLPSPKNPNVNFVNNNSYSLSDQLRLLPFDSASVFGRT